jgi:hypothetical protein
MTNNSLNPFNVTSAKDLTNEEIDSLWVELTGKQGFDQLVKPTSQSPMYILGGKGSGKTHLMRHYSFDLQRLRHQKDLMGGLKRDGYIGIYQRCSGLNSNRFSQKGLSEDVWNALFGFYTEIWFSQILLSAILAINKVCTEFIPNEASFCSAVINLFDKEFPFEGEKNIQNLNVAIHSIQRQIDFAVNNVAFSGGAISVEIIVTDGDLLYGIPRICQDLIPSFRDMLFVYLIDEYENLLESQQRHFNTLLREKEKPATFKVGARLYGVKTFFTNSGNEENKRGSEYESLHLDAQFRSTREAYVGFTKQLCAKRLIALGRIASLDLKNGDLLDVSNAFEPLDITAYCTNLLARRTEAPYFAKLRGKLNQFPEEEVRKIIDLLSVQSDPIVERTNLFLFYREWKAKPRNLIDIAGHVCEDGEKYRSDPAAKTQHRIVLKKYRRDIFDQLIVECGGSVPYVGLSDFTRMSDGIPRNLIIILKHIYRWAEFHGESPFLGGKISIKSQNAGILDASDWFYEDARPGGKGFFVRNAISRLGRFIREIKYSDVPPECSLVGVRIKESEMSEQASEILLLATQYSYLINVGERKDKNTRRKDPLYKLNGILVPKWDLAISKRGEISLDEQETAAIFDPEWPGDFEAVVSKRLAKYNAPFNVDGSNMLLGFE